MLKADTHLSFLDISPVRIQTDHKRHIVTIYKNQSNMAPYNTPQAIRPLEKTICDFAYSNGYDPISVSTISCVMSFTGSLPAHRPLWIGNTNGSRTGILWRCLPDGYGSCSGNCNPADGLMRSVTSSWQYLPNRSAGERTVLYPAGYLRPDGLMYRFGETATGNVSVTRHAEAEGYCWHIMYAT